MSHYPVPVRNELAEKYGYASPAPAYPPAPALPPAPLSDRAPTLYDQNLPALDAYQLREIGDIRSMELDTQLREARVGAIRSVFQGEAQIANTWLLTRQPGESHIDVDFQARSVENSFFNFLGAGRGENFRARLRVTIR